MGQTAHEVDIATLAKSTPSTAKTLLERHLSALSNLVRTTCMTGVPPVGSEVSREYIASILSSPRLGQVLGERDGLRTALELYTPHHPRLASLPPTLLTGALPIRNSAPGPEVSAPNHVTDRPSSSGLIESVAMAMDSGVDIRSHRMAPQVYRLPFGR
jgi:hypothetical protein